MRKSWRGPATELWDENGTQGTVTGLNRYEDSDHRCQCGCAPEWPRPLKHSHWQLPPLVPKRRYLIQHADKLRLWCLDWSLPVALCFTTKCKMRGKGARLEEVMHSQIFCIVSESMPATYSSTDWGEKRKGDWCSGDNFLPVPKTGMKIYLWRKKNTQKKTIRRLMIA